MLTAALLLHLIVNHPWLSLPPTLRVLGSVRMDEEQEAAFLWWRIKFTSATGSLPQGWPNHRQEPPWVESELLKAPVPGLRSSGLVGSPRTLEFCVAERAHFNKWVMLLCFLKIPALASLLLNGILNPQQGVELNPKQETDAVTWTETELKWQCFSLWILNWIWPGQNPENSYPIPSLQKQPGGPA